MSRLALPNRPILLRNSIIFLFGGLALLIGAAVTVPAILILNDSERRLDELETGAQIAGFRNALEDAAVPLRALARNVAADPAVQTALASARASDLRERLAALLAGSMAGSGARRLELVSPGGELLAAAPAAMDTHPMARLGPGGVAAVGLDRPAGGKLLLAVTLPLPRGAAMTVAGEPVAAELEASLGAPFIILDRERQPLAASRADLWPLLQPQLPAGGERLPGLVSLDGLAHRLVVTRLTDTAGGYLGELATLRDAAIATARRRLTVLLAVGLLAATLLVIAALLYRTIRTTLDPLTEVADALQAVAGGDLFASASIRRRTDEVGEIAGALETVRAGGLALDRLQTRERLREKRERAVIHTQMVRLAEVLRQPTRDEVMAMLTEASAPPPAVVGAGPASADGGRLARAFIYMSDMVIGQHGQLVTLLEERTRDLAVVRQALAERRQLTRLREELEVARHLQLSSLPTQFPARPEFQLHAHTLPAREVGGDFYDFVQLDADRLAISIGDAAGKGVPAAMFMAMTRGLIRAALLRGATPGQALTQANEMLSVDNPSLMFATAFTAVLHIPTGRLDYAGAGHNPPRLRRAAGEEGVLHGPLGIALGVMEGVHYDDHAAQLGPGDTLLTYSDGVTEAYGPDDTLFGDDRLAALMRVPGLPAPRELIERIGREVERFADGEPQADDITMLALALAARD